MEQRKNIHFLSKDLESIKQEIKNLQESPSSIYATLNRLTDFSWSYEIEKLQTFNEGTECHAIIRLNVGDKKMLGVATNDPQETDNILESAVERAIRNALHKMLSFEEVSSPVIPHVVKDVSENRIPQEEKETIPFIKKETVPAGTVETAPALEQKPSGGKSAFTSVQIEKMLKFKKDFNVMNEEQLLAHLKTWNPLITSKHQLNTTNIEDFFRYVDDLSEGGF